MDNGLDYISAFAKALKPFGLFIADVSKDDGDTIELIITDTKPENEWDT